jgi:hypothetical protein
MWNNKEERSFVSVFPYAETMATCMGRESIALRKNRSKGRVFPFDVQISAGEIGGMLAWLPDSCATPRCAAIRVGSLAVRKAPLDRFDEPD